MQFSFQATVKKKFTCTINSDCSLGVSGAEFYLITDVFEQTHKLLYT